MTSFEEKDNLEMPDYPCTADHSRTNANSQIQIIEGDDS